MEAGMAADGSATTVTVSRWPKRPNVDGSFDGLAGVADSTGAGDAFAAGWLVGGPGLALEAAARCVQHAGSMPQPAS